MTSVGQHPAIALRPSPLCTRYDPVVLGTAQRMNADYQEFSFASRPKPQVGPPTVDLGSGHGATWQSARRPPPYTSLQVGSSAASRRGGLAAVSSFKAGRRLTWTLT